MRRKGTGEPWCSESEHARFGGGPSEKGLVTGTSLAAYPTHARFDAAGTGNGASRHRASLRPYSDLLSKALAHPGTGPLLVERSDGHTSTTDLGWWLHQHQAGPPGDFAALNWAGPGTAEDVGCCTGRHLQYLAGRGISAHGIDTCQTAVTLARAAGTRADLADAHTYTPPQPVDTVIALGGGPGIAGTLTAVPAFLARLASWLTPTGQLIVSSVDWTATADQHRGWVDQATAEGRYPGEVRLRLRHQEAVGDWFDWVWLDPRTLQDSAAQAGLHVADLRRFGPAWYAASLRSTP